MRLDFFVKLKKRSSTIILSVSIKYSVRHLLRDVIALKVAMCITYGKWYQCSLWHHLAVASCKFHFQTTFYVKKCLWFTYFLSLWFFNTILIMYTDFRLLYKHINWRRRSHREYLIQYDDAHFILKIDEKSLASMAVLIDFNEDSR